MPAFYSTRRRITALSALWLSLCGSVAWGQSVSTPVTPGIVVDARLRNIKGDNSTDNAAAIEAAVTALASDGATLYFPPGIYLVNTPVDINRNNVNIHIAPGAIVKAAAGYTDDNTKGVLCFGDGSTVYTNVSVSGGGKIDANSVASRCIQMRGPLVNPSVRGSGPGARLEVTGATSTCVNIEGVSAANPAIRPTIEFVYCHDNNEGLQIFKATDAFLNFNRVETMTGSDCLEFSQVTRGQIIGNSALNPGNGNSGIDVFEASTDIIVADNICRQTSAATTTSGIALGQNSVAPSRVNITDNDVSGAFATGIVIGTAVDVRVAGGQIHDITGDTAITSSGERILIDGVTIQTIDQYCIQLLGGSATIVNCTLRNPSIANATNGHIHAFAGDNHLIARNRFLNDTGDPKNWFNLMNTAGVITVFVNNYLDGNLKAGGRPIETQNDADLITRHNTGFASESSGTFTIPNGSTSVAVNHSLGLTPSTNQIILTPTNNLGTATQVWVSAVSSTQITVSSDADPGATTATGTWRVVPE